MKHFCRLGLAIVGVSTGVALVSCSSEPRRSTAVSSVARWHFVGATQLQTQSTAPALASILVGTNSAPTGERLASNLVSAVLRRLGHTNTPLEAGTLAPLMADLLRHESAGEVAGSGWRLTVKLPSERVAAWQGAGSLLGGLTGSAGSAVLGYTNGWLTAGAGTVSLSSWLTLSNGAVLAAEGDLAKIFNGSRDNWPRIQVEASLQAGKVITRAGADFLKPPLRPLPAWKLPDRRAHGPFSQFAAARGISSLGGRIDWWREAFAGQPPDQAFWWSQPEVPFRNWMAVPTKNPTGDIERLAKTMENVFGERGGRSGRVALATNHTAFAILDTLKGLQPVVTEMKQDNDTFLVASLYPAARTTNPISANLRRLLEEKDLVYQDAEFTPEAVDHWNILFQLNHMLQSHLPNARNARAHSWMIENRSQLGDSETVIRQTSPLHLNLERKSSAGITGIELVMLTRWLDGNDYLFRHATPPPTPGDGKIPPKP